MRPPRWFGPCCGSWARRVTRSERARTIKGLRRTELDLARNILFRGEEAIYEFIKDMLWV